MGIFIVSSKDKMLKDMSTKVSKQIIKSFHSFTFINVFSVKVKPFYRKERNIAEKV